VKIRLFAAVVCASALFARVIDATEPAWVTRSNVNSQLLLKIMAKYSPESASQIGVDGYDEAILDLSRDQYEPMMAELRQAIVEYRKRAAGETDAKVRQDLEILMGSAADSISNARLSRKYFIPFNDVAGLVFGVANNTIDPRIPLARQQSLLLRLQKYTGTAKGFRPITELAKERTLERIQADTAHKLLGPYQGELEQTISDEPTMVAGIRSLLQKSRLKGWEGSVALLDKQLADYNRWLKSELLPRARADHRLPPEVYADNLHQYGVDISPEEMIARALTSFAEIRTQMQITAALVAKEKGFADSDYHAVLRKLKEQQVPESEVMAVYKDRLAQVEAAIREHRIVTLPTRPASIRLATPAENAQMPAPHMDAPRMIGNTGEYGEFVLSTALPPDASGKAQSFDDFSSRGVTWTLTAHEARPGHELQFARIIESGVSIARAVFAFNSVNVEGWGLYSEAEMQPYEPLDGQLFTLQMRAHRAARAFLDPMVNLGQIKPEDVKQFLMREVCYSEGFATSEMQRYVFRAPGQATSYFYGYQRLMETRQAAQLALGDKFDRMAFNDFVLSQGLLPPKLLRKSVMEEFVRH
jgi:Bacterial protein of unknown function (DUF885)